LEEEDRQMLKRLPGWAKVLLVLVTVVCILLFLMRFWWVIAIGFFFWLFVWIFAGASSSRRHRDEVNININQTEDSPRSQSWVRRGLGTNYYVPKINQKGADFITGRRKRKQ
jgi:hypothetical protein